MIAQTINGFANRMSVAKGVSLRRASTPPGEFPISARPPASEFSSVFLPQDASMRTVAADGHGQLAAGRWLPSRPSIPWRCVVADALVIVAVGFVVGFRCQLQCGLTPRSSGRARSGRGSAMIFGARAPLNASVSHR